MLAKEIYFKTTLSVKMRLKVSPNVRVCVENRKNMAKNAKKIIGKISE